MVFKHTYEEMLEQAYKELPRIEAVGLRFEVPKVESLIQGNRTVVKNVAKLASHLRQSLDHLMRFMLHELATTGELRGADAIFIGKFRNDFLNEKVQKYTKRFVLCDHCGKPDTHLGKEGGITFKHCEACGAKIAVESG